MVLSGVQIFTHLIMNAVSALQNVTNESFGRFIMGQRVGFEIRINLQ